MCFQTFKKQSWVCNRIVTVFWIITKKSNLCKIIIWSIFLMQNFSEKDAKVDIHLEHLPPNYTENMKCVFNEIILSKPLGPMPDLFHPLCLCCKHMKFFICILCVALQIYWSHLFKNWFLSFRTYLQNVQFHLILHMASPYLNSLKIWDEHWVRENSTHFVSLSLILMLPIVFKWIQRFNV